MNIWYNLKTIIFYLINLAADFTDYKAIYKVIDSDSMKHKSSVVSLYTQHLMKLKFWKCFVYVRFLKTC